jgi:signal peptidase I
MQGISAEAVQVTPAVLMDRYVPVRDTRWDHPLLNALRRIILLVVVAVSIRTFIGEASVVPTPSMEGTILVGDHLLLNKFAYAPQVPFTDWHLPRLKHVRRGDIVAFRFLANAGEPELSYLKRVIAIGGDTIELRDGVLYINGKITPEPYLVYKPQANSSRNMLPQRIPPGQLFVMGDNRDYSSDSRAWGTVPESNVIGEPIMIFWSYRAPSSKWLEANWRTKMRFYGSVITHFATNTRWERTGTLL